MAVRATIEEVAAAAGVSRSTVSRVVNGASAVSPEAVAAVRAAIERLGYVPNRAARSLASRQTHAIALIVPEDTTRFFGDPFFAEIVAGITGALAGSDYLLNLLVAGDDPHGKMTGFVRNGGVDGALIVSHHTDDAFVERIADAVPVVWGGRPARQGASEFVVDVDNVAAARTATEHLIARGCTRIATITGPDSMLASVDRIAGFRSALADAGLAPVGEEAGDFSERSGADAASRAPRARGCCDHRLRRLRHRRRDRSSADDRAPAHVRDGRDHGRRAHGAAARRGAAIGHDPRHRTGGTGLGVTPGRQRASSAVSVLFHGSVKVSVFPSSAT